MGKTKKPIATRIKETEEKVALMKAKAELEKAKKQLRKEQRYR